ncbi:hypothetical protein NPIL_298061, partial [Nephila pilipes]
LKFLRQYTRTGVLYRPAFAFSPNCHFLFFLEYCMTTAPVFLIPMELSEGLSFLSHWIELSILKLERGHSTILDILVREFDPI